MADEITKLEHYHQGRLGDSLVEVFHRIDLMLKDQQYSQELAGMRREQEEEGGMLEAGPPDGAPNGEVGPHAKCSMQYAGGWGGMRVVHPHVC